MGRVNLFTSFLSLSFFSFLSAAPLFDGEISVGYIKQSPSGWVQYKGDKVDIENDLQIEDEDSFFLKAKLKHPVPFLPNLYLMFTKMSFNGDGTVKRSYTFGNITIDINDRIITDLKLDHYDIGLFYSLPFLNTLSLGKVSAEAGLYLRIIDFKARVENKTRNTVDETSSTIPIPLLYLGIFITPFEKIALNAEGKAIVYDGNYYYDLQGEVRFYPLSFGLGNAFVSAGYKYEKLKLDDIDDTSADIEITQPFISAGFSF
ncbi:MAG: TIGR04219 family outer membrane beta-barrel protein [Aquificae bacterium]|nr:TIGR04219 family outer membrane beta-barrel protein [Aquificota bacterium]